MKIFKTIVRYVLMLAAALLVLSPFWIKFVPISMLSPLTGKVAAVDTLLCGFSVQVSGESMKPLIEPGTSLKLDRCFEEKDLTEGTVVLFADNADLRLGIIRHVLPLDPIVYKVSTEKTPERFHDVTKEEITAMTKNVDTTQSVYHAEKEAASFILDANEYLTDFYLAAIPRGAGIEASTVERTASFETHENKFCFVIIPKKEVRVDAQIVNAKTNETIPLGTGMVFNVRSEPNINCMEFGSEQGMLSLNPGSYRYKLLLNHQVLKDIPFDVR